MALGFLYLVRGNLGENDIIGQQKTLGNAVFPRVFVWSG